MLWVWVCVPGVGIRSGSMLWGGSAFRVWVYVPGPCSGCGSTFRVWVYVPGVGLRSGSMLRVWFYFRVHVWVPGLLQ
eukprot:7067282-Pyramimonas_sp.AAC.1